MTNQKSGENQVDFEALLEQMKSTSNNSVKKVIVETTLTDAEFKAAFGKAAEQTKNTGNGADVFYVAICDLYSQGKTTADIRSKMMTANFGLDEKSDVREKQVDKIIRGAKNWHRRQCIGEVLGHMPDCKDGTINQFFAGKTDDKTIAGIGFGGYSEYLRDQKAFDNSIASRNLTPEQIKSKAVHVLSEAYGAGNYEQDDLDKLVTMWTNEQESTITEEEKQTRQELRERKSKLLELYRAKVDEAKTRHGNVFSSTRGRKGVEVNFETLDLSSLSVFDD